MYQPEEHIFGSLGSYLWPYTLIAILLVIIPGPDFLLVTSAALRGRTLSGILTAVGICLGCILWTLLAALGLVELLKLNQILYNALVISGIFYMFYLGVVEIKASLLSTSIVPNETKAVSFSSSISYLINGLLVNILNPKVGIFYMTVLPQFIPNKKLTIQNILLLGGIHIVFTLFWLTFCSIAIDRTQAIINNPRFERCVMFLAGLVIIFFAIFLIINNFLLRQLE